MLRPDILNVALYVIFLLAATHNFQCLRHGRINMQLPTKESLHLVPRYKVKRRDADLLNGASSIRRINMRAVASTSFF